MKSRSLKRFAAGVAAISFLLPLLSACGSKEEKPPPGYYDGPRAPKGVSNDQNPAATGSSGSANTGTPR